MSSRTILSGAQALIGDPRNRRFEATDIEVTDGKITAIGLHLDPTGAEVQDVSWAWILPGFVDTHQHLWQSTMRALTSDFTLDDYFWTIRRNHSTRHRPIDVYNGTFGGAISQLDAGTTTTVDFSHCILTPEHADAGVTGITDAGIRAVWCYGFYHQPMDDPYFTHQKQRFQDARRVRSTFFSSDQDRVRFGVAPTEMAREPFETIRQEILMGRELDGLVHPHTNTRWRPGHRSDIKQWHDAGLIWKNQLHSHCNSSDEQDLKILRDAGCGVSSTPETELGMGLGYTILRAADRAGVATGLGADIQSNNSPDLFTAMRLALASERGRYQQPIIETAGTSALDNVALKTEDVLHFATLGGAIGLGLGDVCGSIDVGKAADLLFIRRDSPRLHPVVDPINAIVMHLSVADVDTVMVDGEVVKKDGRLRKDLTVKAINGLDTSGAWIDQTIRDHGGWRPPKPEWMGTPQEHLVSNSGQ